MGKKQTDKSVFDIAVEIADEIGDDDLNESVRQLRDHQSLQKARAEAVLQELTSGLPDKPTEDDGIDYLDYVTDRLNKTIADNLDADSIYEFLLLCGVHIADFRDSVRGSTRGVKGLEAKHLTSRELRKWAVDHAKGMSGSPTDRANNLMKTVPVALTTGLKDPERIIREAIGQAIEEGVYRPKF